MKLLKLMLASFTIMALTHCHDQTAQSKACGTGPIDFEFAHISDVHIGYSAAAQTRLIGAIEALNSRGVKFILNTGDISNDAHDDLDLGLSQWNIYMDAVSASNNPVYNVVGNHDISFSASFQVNSRPAYESAIGETDYIFEENGLQFVVTSDVPGTRTGATFTAAQIDTIAAALDTGKPTFIAGHIPLYPLTASGHTVEDLISTHSNALGFVGGHLHAASFSKGQVLAPALKDHGKYLLYRVGTDIEVCEASIYSAKLKHLGTIDLH